jgi:nucleoside-diphosphate-sugar epimerase
LSQKSLVIGGTGTTGRHVVRGLVERGHEVTILHRGLHEIPETPTQVEHIHVDPYDETALASALTGRDFHTCFAMYGRLRAVARVLQGRVENFISVGGAPAYRGYMNPELSDLYGMTVPIPEGAQKTSENDGDEKGRRIALTEQAVFALQPEATHFRYPYIYGPYQPMPREWLFVRRILDGRKRIILPDGGLTLHSFGHSENIAHGLLLALDHPDVARGKIYNIADVEVLSLRQVGEVIARHMGVAVEFVNIPWELASCTLPLIAQPLTSHRVQDLTLIRNDLGYTDKVPVREALARTTDWLCANPPPSGGTEEIVLQDPFDYPAEDRLLAAWDAARDSFPEISYSDTQPGYTLSYSGPAGRQSSKAYED